MSVHSDSDTPIDDAYMGAVVDYVDYDALADLDIRTQEENAHAHIMCYRPGERYHLYTNYFLVPHPDSDDPARARMGAEARLKDLFTRQDIAQGPSAYTEEKRLCEEAMQTAGPEMREHARAYGRRVYHEHAYCAETDHAAADFVICKLLKSDNPTSILVAVVDLPGHGCARRHFRSALREVVAYRAEDGLDTVEVAEDIPWCLRVTHGGSVSNVIIERTSTLDHRTIGSAVVVWVHETFGWSGVDENPFYDDVLLPCARRGQEAYVVYSFPPLHAHGVSRVRDVPQVETVD